MNNAEIVEKMHDIIKERGLAHGALEINGKVCLLGAGRLAQIGRIYGPIETKSDSRTAEALGMSCSEEVFCLNDGIPYFEHMTEGTSIGENPLTQEQALDLLMERAKYWRNED